MDADRRGSLLRWGAIGGSVVETGASGGRGASVDGAIVGTSAQARALREEVRRIAPLGSTVLVTGETGVGKGLVARALHRHSGRPAVFVHADCAALAPSVIESELFGHERGAFTGAVARHCGRLERAAKGTLFLDEVGELDLPLQARLLRVLQDRVFERVGGQEPLPLDARVVAATNRDLVREVREGRFRADLYYRLAVLHVEVSPLRERPVDIVALVEPALERLGRALRLPPPRLLPGARDCLLRHPWPGNVRELLNALERLCIRCAGSDATAPDVGAVLGPAFDLHSPVVWSLREAPADEPGRIAAALRESEGNVAAAARKLCMPRTTLRRRIEEHGLVRNGSTPACGECAIPEDESQRDHGNDAPVQDQEHALRYPPEDPAPEPGARDDGAAKQQQRKCPVCEGEAHDAEDADLDQVADRLAGRLGTDDGVAIESEIQEERRDERPRGSDGHVHGAHHRAERQKALLPRDVLRVGPQQQELWGPGGQQHECADQRPRQGG